MVWDEELLELTERVRKAYGNAAVADAYVRALVTAPELRGADSVIVDEGEGETKLIDGQASAEYLKAELRRMLMAH